MTGDRPLPPRVTASRHLTDLLRDADRLAERVAAAGSDARELVAERIDEDVVVATLRLDGSPVEEAPPPIEVGPPPTPAPATTDLADADAYRRGTWLDALRVTDDAPTATVIAMEAAGVRAALSADDLARSLREDLAGSLSELHRRLTAGLVAPERAGAYRRTEQAVHDASVGRVIYFTAEPDAVPGEVEQLASWYRATDDHPVVASGLLHLELLRLHPFDAANGRLARATARLALRGAGWDPDGLAAAEPPLARDPMGYHQEVARTIRRRDATVWLERWGEAVGAGLRTAARRLGVLEAAVPARCRTALTTVGPDLTVAEYRDAAGLDRMDEVVADLTAALDAGLVERVPGTRGLRYRRVADAPPPTGRAG